MMEILIADIKNRVIRLITPLPSSFEEFNEHMSLPVFKQNIFLSIPSSLIIIPYQSILVVDGDNLLIIKYIPHKSFLI
jgi:pantothenate kinase